MRLPARLAENLQEARTVGRVAPERGVDAIAVAPQGTQRPRRHPLQFRMPLYRQERIEHRAGSALEQRLVAKMEELVDRDVVIVDRNGLRRHWKQPRMQVLQQDDVDLADELRRTVIALHQLLARPLRRRVGETDLARQRVLQIEDEPVLAATGEIMQPHAQDGKRGFMALEDGVQSAFGGGNYLVYVRR